MGLKVKGYNEKGIHHPGKHQRNKKKKKWMKLVVRDLEEEEELNRKRTLEKFFVQSVALQEDIEETDGRSQE